MQLSRDEMIAEINAGRSILFNPDDQTGAIRQAVRVEDLPTEAEMARRSGDPGRVEAARDDLLARRAALEAQLAALEGPAPEPGG